MTNVYETIYDTINENMRLANKTFSYDKETFLRDVGTPSWEIDVSKYLDLPFENFKQAICVVVLRRLPDEYIEKLFRRRKILSEEECKIALLKWIENTGYVAINHIKFINNPYFTQKRGVKYRLIRLLYCLTEKTGLRRFGKTLPQPIQNVLRRFFC